MCGCGVMKLQVKWTCVIESLAMSIRTFSSRVNLFSVILSKWFFLIKFKYSTRLAFMMISSKFYAYMNTNRKKETGKQEEKCERGKNQRKTWKAMKWMSSCCIYYTFKIYYTLTWLPRSFLRKSVALAIGQYSTGCMF